MKKSNEKIELSKTQQNEASSYDFETREGRLKNPVLEDLEIKH